MAADMEAALLARALADAPLTALAGARGAWGISPQGQALPRYTFQIVPGPREQNYKGFDALQATRVQADAWAATHLAAKQVMEALLAALVPAATQSGITFSRALVDSEGERDSGVEGIFRRSADLIIWWQPA